MTFKSQPVRGTHDLMGEELLKHYHIIAIAQEKAKLYGYEPIATPIFEQTSVFKRTLGETSDVVGKEMYTFSDRGGEELTLRPEGTAGVVRAVISGGLTQNLPLKFIYNGPMMRYERPQLGRRRQFHQLGVEYLGVLHPLADAETIHLAYEILQALNLRGSIRLDINTLGDLESRQRYRALLVEYLQPYFSDLSADSQERLTKNPLRILDSKNTKDQEITAEVPPFSKSLSADSQAYFEAVCEGLTKLNIDFQVNNRLVRGLDYYTHTAFEFVTTDLGAQGTVCAGGRYDGLISQMGGPDTGAVGWALGLDRLALLSDSPCPDHPFISVISIGDEIAQSYSFSVATTLRKAGLKVDMIYSKNLAKQLKRANKVQSQWAILSGEDEVKANQVTIRNLKTGEQKLIDISTIIEYVQGNNNGNT